MLNNFLLQNEDEILALTELKTLELAGDHPSSEQLKRGLPIFYRQIIDVIGRADQPESTPPKDVGAIANAADRGDEPAMAEAAGQPMEATLARTAGMQGFEMLRLGYTLSHVVHAYGAMCQAITEVAGEKNALINAGEFHALNRCLDVAIAGAVTSYEARKESSASSAGDSASQGLAEEMLSVLTRAKVAFQAVQSGAVGVGGITAQSLGGNLLRLEQLIDQLLAGTPHSLSQIGPLVSPS